MTITSEYLNPNQNTPASVYILGHNFFSPAWCKKVVAKNIKGHAEKCEIKMGDQGLLLLMELKFLIMITRLHNITVACQL